MPYCHLSYEERRILITMHTHGETDAEIARKLGRHRATISRELARNAHENNGRSYYTHSKAHQKAIARRSRSKRNRRFIKSDWELIKERLKRDWSPEQVAERLKKEGLLSICHDTIYKYIAHDKKQGGTVYKHLRQQRKKKRKRYGSVERRGKLQGKRMIGERPEHINNRSCLGHWEIDTIMGKGSKHCLLTLTERKSGYLIMSKMTNRTTEETTKAAIKMIDRMTLPCHTITSDNGSEFHGYKDIEAATKVTFYFANPHHSWERGTNENTNGLIRQYAAKGTDLKTIDQDDCRNIERHLNTRPRRRLMFDTPQEAISCLGSLLH